MDQLHTACDIFVSASHGEAWGIPAHDAMGFGNPVILSNWGSYPELMHRQSWPLDKKESWICQDANPGEIDCGWLIDGQLTPCFGMTDSFPDLYTGDEQWFDPNICHLIECIQQAYDRWNNGELNIMGKAAMKHATNFSYENVGAIAKELLET